MKRESVRAEDLLRDMRSSVAPVDSESAVWERRERTIGMLRSAQLRMRTDQKRTRARARWRFVAAAALVPALAAAFAVYRTHHEPTTPTSVVAATPTVRLRALEGHVDLVHGGRSSEAKSGIDALLDTGDAIRTANASRAMIALPSGASVQASALTNLAVSLPDPAHRETIDLALGRVDVSVPKLAPGSTLSVHTPNALVTVHGTRFSVIVLEGGDHRLETSVAVTEGIVAVERDGRSVELRAGSTWSSTEVQPPVRVGAGEPPTREASPVAMRRARAVPLKNATRAADNNGSEASFIDERSSTLSEENALMQRAMVSSRNGDDRTAVAVLDALLARYPHSILRENAQVERFRALRRLGDAPEASREARRYLVEHPEGLGQDEAKRIAVDPRTP